MALDVNTVTALRDRWTTRKDLPEEVLPVIDALLGELARQQTEMDSLSKAITHMQAISTTQVEQYRALEGEYRKVLWLGHGCAIVGLYGDDGEMQCSQGRYHKPLDFKRDSLTLLLDQITQGRMVRMAETGRLVGAPRILYQVQPNETLGAIARQHGLTKSELMALNPQFGEFGDRADEVVFAGERLVVATVRRETVQKGGG